MTDKELLELAAKACADPHIKPGGADFTRWIGYDDGVGCDVFAIWNPLTDDGDAMRLAVKRGILTEHYDYFMRFFYEEISLDNRPSESTRRAIVRAAAEIAKAHPPADT